MPYFGKLMMKDITKKRYQNALNDLKVHGLAYNTIDGVHGTDRMIFKRAVELEVIKTDPTEFAIVPKTQQTLEELESEKEIPKYLEKEELALFLETAKEKGLDRDYIIFLCLAYTGIRIGELCSLKWRDIDFEEQTISITKTLYNPKNNIREYHLLTPKTKSSKRKIDIDLLVLNELEKNRTAQNKIRMRYRDKYHDEGFVFAQTDEKNPGYPLYLKLIRIRMECLLKLAELNSKLTPTLHFGIHTHPFWRKLVYLWKLLCQDWSIVMTSLPKLSIFM